MAIIAYLDPGTGAMIIQALIAGIVGAGFAVKLFWANIQCFFMKLFGKQVESCEKSGSCEVSDVAGKDDVK
jgi:hypothetical protein